MASFEQSLEPYEIDFVEARVVPQLRCPEGLIEALHRRLPDRHEMLRSISSRFPMTASRGPDRAGPLYRLPKHFRSHYLALCDEDRPKLSSPVITVKGSDPLRDDFEESLRWMAKTPFRGGYLSIIDHFPIAEAKLPGAVTYKEAVQEVEISYRVHVDHLRVFGSLAHIPLPLYVHELEPHQCGRYFELLDRHIAPRAKHRIPDFGQAALYVVVSYYPSAPVRADYYDAAAKRYMQESFGGVPDIRKTIAGWVDLFVRLLVLGYLPETPWSKRLGACLDSGNACLDGGFADPDSIVRIEDVPNDEFFFNSLGESALVLFDSATVLLADTMGEDKCNRLALVGYMGQLFSEAIEKYRSAGHELDRRVEQLLRPASYDDLLFLMIRHLGHGFSFGK